MDVEAVTHGSEMTVSSRSNLPDTQMSLEGEVHLRDELPMRLSADFESTELNALLNEYLSLRLTGPSALKMHVEATGDAKHPDDLSAETRGGPAGHQATAASPSPTTAQSWHED
jgi:hypothetical protein